jgi:hypothetical protein
MRNFKELVFLAVLFTLLLVFMLSPARAASGPMILPPLEYDHPYEGDLTIKIVDTLEELYAICEQRTAAMLACSYPSYADGFRSCLIIMVKDEIMRRRGWTTGLLFRHEQGHCNGWLGGDHVGQRPLTTNGWWVTPSERIKVPHDRLERAEKARAGAPQ